MNNKSPFKKAFVFHPEGFAYVEYEVQGDFVVSVACRDTSNVVVCTGPAQIACTVKGWAARKDMFVTAGCRVWEVMK